MARYLFVFSLVILCCATNSFAATDKWQELEMKLDDKINKVEARNVQLEEKVNQLENQLENQRLLNDELRKDLTLKVTRLEAKNVQLEDKVEEQQKILNFLLQATELPFSAGGSFPNNRQIQSEFGKMSGTPRTCRELKATNPSFASGMQWVDPDGQGIGDDPIYVYCDMSTGSTSILHDSESPIDVGHCADPGCYSRSINYNASIKQIKTLAELSSECHQSIKYDCYYVPFELNSVAYAWWNDRDGNAQYFWDGNNTDGIHTCQCGIDGDCVDNSLKCNCDAAAPIQLVDDGAITDKNVLPVTRLNFGRTQLATSSGVHTLGRFECSGSVALTGLPTSCEDLWLIGHTLNGIYSVMENELVKNVYCDFTKLPSDEGFQTLIGYAEVKPKPTYSGIPTSCANLKAAGHTSSGLYSVMGAKMVESVYCDFTKLSNNSDFQKWIGYADVKSAPVHFYVQRNSKFNTTGTPIPFELAVLNEGNAMNLASGIFTAPVTGIYFFSFTGVARFPASTSYVYLNVGLYLNGGLIGEGRAEDANTVDNQFSPLSTLQSTMNLKKGDRVWVTINLNNFGGMSSGAYLVGGYTHFTGFMLKEEIVASL